MNRIIRASFVILFIVLAFNGCQTLPTQPPMAQTRDGQVDDVLAESEAAPLPPDERKRPVDEPQTGYPQEPRQSL